MSLAALTLTALLSVCRAPACTEADHPRLASLAADIAAVVEERAELAAWLPGAVAPLPWGGPAARERAALALVAIASHESALRADVADCRRVGTDLPSVSAFQILLPWAGGPYTRNQICASPRLAAERALWVLAIHAAKCSAALCVFQGYASGSRGRTSAAARRQYGIFEKLVAAARI